MGESIALKSPVRKTILPLRDGGAAVRKRCTSGSLWSLVESSPLGNWVLLRPCGKLSNVCDLRLGEITR